MSYFEDKIKKLQSLLEVSKLLNSSKNMNEILSSLLEKSIELVDAADAGTIFIYNKDIKKLEAAATVGYDSYSMNNKLLPGESISGITFLNNKTTFINGSDGVKQAMSTLSEENRSNLEKSLKTTINNSEIYGSICSPLIYKEDCIGVIIINNIKNRAQFDPDDVALIEAISAQATIAIINAGNFEKELRNNKIMEKYGKLQEEEKKIYQYSSSLHEKFTNMILNGANVGDILIELSSLLNRDVFIIDIFNNIDYYNFKYYTGLETINELIEDFIVNLSKTKKVTYFHPDTKLYMNFFPVLVNINILGWLCIVSDNNHYSELDKITIEVGRTMLSLELLKIKELSSIEQAFKGDFFDNLILNNNREYLIKCAKKYKFNFNSKHKIIIFEIKANESTQRQITNNIELTRYIEQYYNVISEAAGRSLQNPISFIKGNNIIIIIEENGNEKKNIKKLLDKVVSIDNRHISRSKIKITAAVSDIIHCADDFKPAYFATQQVIRMLDNMGGENLYLFYEDLELRKLLLNNPKEDLERFLSITLGPLIEYQKDMKEYLNTLKIYIQSNGNWTYSKDYLHIHGNTLSYRLNRIMSILNVDLNDYNARLKIQVAFEIYDLLK
jgi:sugar diacid utilization regulator/GAF domain-containing protein